MPKGNQKQGPRNQGSSYSEAHIRWNHDTSETDLQLQMYGYEFSWASFQVIEVMSASTSKEKTIGYLAASLSFKPDTDVLMLTTNLIKKVFLQTIRLILGSRVK